MRGRREYPRGGRWRSCWLFIRAKFGRPNFLEIDLECDCPSRKNCILQRERERERERGREKNRPMSVDKKLSIPEGTTGFSLQSSLQKIFVIVRGAEPICGGNIDVRFDPGMGEREGDVEYSNFELIGFVGRCEGIGEI